MSRPSTRLSSREPTRKRRRAPPPLSVTNVFADARLPDNASQLWRWPVTSWYFGDVGNADLHITFDRPFVKDASRLPPLEKHYRLRWLEEDATRLVHARQPLPPEPLPLIPYARQKDTTACARPSGGLGTAVDPNATGRPRKRQCVPRAFPVVEPATIECLGEVIDGPPVAASCAPASAPSKVEPPPIVPKPQPRLVDVKPQNVLQRHSKIPPASNFCTPPLSDPSNTLFSPSETIPSETPLENTSTPSPSSQSTPFPMDDAEEPINTDGKDTQDDHDKSDDDEPREVLLQFISPIEPRLMGTLTYSLPVNPAPVSEKEEKAVIVADPPPKINHNALAEDGICVENMDLEFRKSARPFEDAFDDVDATDELRPEILRLNTLLNGLGPKTKPLRNMIHAVVQSELQRQSELLEREAEEKRIIARLKEIAKEKSVAKAAAKAAEKAAKAKEKAAAGRNSVRFGTQGRRRRPSRKIQDEPDSDEDSARAAQDNSDDEDLKIVSEPVIVDKPAPIAENEALDNRKLLLKPEGKDDLMELVRPILNSPSVSPSVGDMPKGEDIVKPTLDEHSAARTDDGINREVNDGSVKSVPEKRPDIAPDAEPSVRPPVLNNDSKDVEIAAVELKESQRVQPALDESPIPALGVVSPECVTQVGLDQVGNETPPGDMSALHLVDQRVKPLNSNTSNENDGEALAEATKIQSKSLPEQLAEPQWIELPIAMCQDAKSFPDESTEDICAGPHGQLTPLEPEVEVTTTPITEIDMDGSPDSDDESKQKDVPENGEPDEKEEAPGDSGKHFDFDMDSQPIPHSKEESPACGVFQKDEKVADQLDRMPSPVSPLQAASPTCGFVVVPATGPTKVLTSGSALVNHMKAMHAEAMKKNSLPNDS